MSIQNHLLGDVAELLRAQRRVWVRLAVSRPQDEWQLSLLEVTLAEPPLVGVVRAGFTSVPVSLPQPQLAQP
jgi:hypothetical protein